MPPVSPDIFNQFVIGMIFIGLFQCFWGYRLFKVVLHLTGFCLAGLFSLEYARTLFESEALLILVGLLGGIIGALLVILLYYLFVFLMGGYLGIIITHIVCAYFLIELSEWILLGGALTAGALALISQRVMLMLATSYTGAWNVVAGINHFISGDSQDSEYERFFVHDDMMLYVISALWVVLGTISFYLQMKYTPKELSDKEKKEGVKVAPEKK